MNRFISTVQQSAIREIVREIAKGNTCYMNRNTSKIITIDNSIEDVAEITAQKQTQIEIEKKIEKFVKLNKLSEKIQLMIMKDFMKNYSPLNIIYLILFLINFNEFL